MYVNSSQVDIITLVTLTQCQLYSCDMLICVTIKGTYHKFLKISPSKYKPPKIRKAKNPQIHSKTKQKG